MRGRKRTPTNDLKLTGTFRKDRHGDREHEPQLPSASDLTAPKWLSQPACEEWDRVASMLSERGVLTDADRATLAAYCADFALFVEADEQYRETGGIVHRNSGPAKSPWLTIRKEAHDGMLRAAAELGMTPTARSRVRAVEKESKPRVPARRRTGA